MQSCEQNKKSEIYRTKLGNQETKKKEREKKKRGIERERGEGEREKEGKGEDGIRPDNACASAGPSSIRTKTTHRDPGTRRSPRSGGACGWKPLEVDKEITAIKGGLTEVALLGIAVGGVVGVHGAGSE